MDGLKTIVLAGTQSGKPASTDYISKHCPYCAAHAGVSSALPTASFVFGVLEMSSSYPPLFYQSTTPLFSWTAAKPRGPPSLI